jgi:hypothetical protein
MLVLFVGLVAKRLGRTSLECFGGELELESRSRLGIDKMGFYHL